MLDAFALIFAKEFLDLAVVVLALVERDADLVVGRSSPSRTGRSDLPLDVEIADLAEVEEPLVEVGPMVHPPAVHIVGEVIEIGEVRGVARLLSAASGKKSKSTS